MADPKSGLYVLRIDGGKRAIKGMAEGAIGVVLQEPDETPIKGAELSECIGPVTSPLVSEYRALIRGLEMAKDREVDFIAAFSDSRTLVNQVNGLWERRRDLRQLCEEAREILKRFKGWQVSWVPREWNAMADELVDKAFKGEDCPPR